MINFQKNIFGFDFDNTLDKPVYQLIAHYLKSIGKTLKVCTKRTETNNPDEVYKITDMLQIPREFVVFTDNQPKASFLIDMDVQVFFDDRQDNLDEINKNAPDIDTILAK